MTPAGERSLLSSRAALARRSRTIAVFDDAATLAVRRAHDIPRKRRTPADLRAAMIETVMQSVPNDAPIPSPLARRLKRPTGRHLLDGDA